MDDVLRLEAADGQARQELADLLAEHTRIRIRMNKIAVGFIVLISLVLGVGLGLGFAA